MTERLEVLLVLVVVIGIPAGITLSKGKSAEFSLGWITLGLVWWFAIFRLAHPSSWWARHFYGLKKMQRAEKRYGSETSVAS